MPPYEKYLQPRPESVASSVAHRCNATEDHKGWKVCKEHESSPNIHDGRFWIVAARPNPTILVSGVLPRPMAWIALGLLQFQMSSRTWRIL